MNYHRIIIVGETNLIRSFMAGVILRGLLQKNSGEPIKVFSRGTVVLFSEPVAPKAAAVVTRHGYDIKDFRSSQISQEDINSADLVLAMNQYIYEYLKSDYDISQTSCMSISTFLGIEANVPAIKEDTEEAYESCFTSIEQLMEAVAEKIIVEVL